MGVSVGGSCDEANETIRPDGHKPHVEVYAHAGVSMLFEYA